MSSIDPLQTVYGESVSAAAHHDAIGVLLLKLGDLAVINHKLRGALVAIEKLTEDEQDDWRAHVDRVAAVALADETPVIVNEPDYAMHPDALASLAQLLDVPPSKLAYAFGAYLAHLLRHGLLHLTTQE